jgi:hypothetical protein
MATVHERKFGDELEQRLFLRWRPGVGWFAVSQSADVADGDTVRIVAAAMYAWL